MQARQKVDLFTFISLFYKTKNLNMNRCFLGTLKIKKFICGGWLKVTPNILRKESNQNQDQVLIFSFNHKCHVGGGGNQPVFWHERTAFQRSAFRQLTAGNDVVATIFILPFLFPPPFFPRFFILRRDLFSQKECSDQKSYLAKVAQKALKPRRPFWGPLAAILDFAGGAALQAVRECP